jgi:DNA-binding NarL/FixJ family response regulator
VTVRVVLVDDHALFRAGVRAELVATAPRIEIVGEAADVEEAMAQVVRCRADVVIADLGAPEGCALTLARRVRALWPWVQVVVHAEEPDPEAVGRARMAGAAEVVTGPLRAHPWELLAAVGRAYVAGLSARW